MINSKENCPIHELRAIRKIILTMIEIIALIISKCPQFHVCISSVIKRKEYTLAFNSFLYQKCSVSWILVDEFSLDSLQSKSRTK